VVDRTRKLRQEGNIERHRMKMMSTKPVRHAADLVFGKNCEDGSILTSWIQSSLLVYNG